MRSLTLVMMVGGLAYRRGMWRPRAAASVTIQEAERIAAEGPAAAEILTLAEAMALGKPTIATGYSGNLDFMKDRKSTRLNSSHT